MKIKKEEILKAIATEKLRPQDWFHVDGLRNVPIGQIECSVCAVGAVLREAFPLVNQRDLRYFCSMNVNTGNVHENLVAGDWLSALSSFYEERHNEDDELDSSEIYSVDEDRLALNHFVNEHFPEAIEVDITV